MQPIDNSEAICSPETFFKLEKKFTSDKDTEAQRTGEGLVARDENPCELRVF